MRLIQGDYKKTIMYCSDMLKGDFFEFDFPFVPMDERFREIDRFLWESKHQCTRFKNRYEGCAIIDISDWSRHFPNDYFDAFMYFLKDNEAFTPCALISSEPCSSEVRGRLERLFSVKEVNLFDNAETAGSRKTAIGFCIGSEEEDREDV